MSEWRKQAITIIDDLILNHEIKSVFEVGCDDAGISRNLAEKYPNIQFKGVDFREDKIEEANLLKDQSNLKNVNFIMGVGGSFDVVSGLVKRAPQWMQKFGLEWLYRLIQEPKRMWKPYLIGNTKFILLVVREFFSYK